MTRWHFAGGLLLSVVATVVAAEGSAPHEALLPGGRGVRFVEESSCRGCHEAQTTAWTGSHHDLAMEPASNGSVKGDFDDAKFVHEGVETRFFRRDGDFYVRTEGPDGKLADFRIAYTFGVDPLQQYLVGFPGGRLQTLTIAWDTRNERWLTLYPDERIASDDALHWTGRYQTWNFMCAECHSTDLRKGYDAETDSYETTWARIDVGCQACHGPGAAHVDWARSGATSAGPGRDTGFVVDLAAMAPAEQVDACARCHARRHRVSPEDLHGRPFLDDFAPERLREGLYQPDGQIEEEVYVYGSFLQSRMYAAGVGCMDCHEPHSLSLVASDNALCGQCHGPNPPVKRFPSLTAREYDSPKHHFHSSGSEGARCVNCHMPERVYMQVDPRRDHGFRVPRPDLSQKLGVRNACTGCHTERSNGWAVEALDGWMSERERADWRRGSEHAATFYDARRGSPGAAEGLVEIAEDPELPAIVRATALEQLRAYGPVGGGAVTGAALDPEPLVRAAAAGGLDLVAPSMRGKLAATLLADPTRAVRTEAARALVSVSAELTPEQRKTLDRAVKELEAAERVNADGPGARTNLAVLARGQGRTAEAEAHYRAALRLDKAFFPASLNLAAYYNGEERNAEAEQVLKEAIRHSPEQGELYYSLGLLLAEQQRLAEAEKALGAAAQRIPDRSRVRYNHALALQHLGRRSQAERELLEALRLEPSDPAISEALVIFYAQDRRFEEALPHAERLAELVPEARGLLRQVQNEIARSGGAGRR